MSMRNAEIYFLENLYIHNASGLRRYIWFIAMMVHGVATRASYVRNLKPINFDRRWYIINDPRKK